VWNTLSATAAYSGRTNPIWWSANLGEWNQIAAERGAWSCGVAVGWHVKEKGANAKQWTSKGYGLRSKQRASSVSPGPAFAKSSFLEKSCAPPKVKKGSDQQTMKHRKERNRSSSFGSHFGNASGGCAERPCRIVRVACLGDSCYPVSRDS
jgi:hypothetical protein